MKALRIIAALGTLAGVSLLTSCSCCTGENAPIGLRELPEFAPLPSPIVEATK